MKRENLLDFTINKYQKKTKLTVPFSIERAEADKYFCL